MHQGKVVEEGAGSAAESEALGAGGQRVEPRTDHEIREKEWSVAVRSTMQEIWTYQVFAATRDEAEKLALDGRAAVVDVSETEIVSNEIVESEEVEP